MHPIDVLRFCKTHIMIHKNSATWRQRGIEDASRPFLDPIGAPRGVQTAKPHAKRGNIKGRGVAAKQIRKSGKRR